VGGWGNTPVARLEGAPCPYHNKTATSIGAAELLDRWPILIVAPGHILHKWARSIAQACDPDDPITPRIITRPVRKKDDFWWGEIVEKLAKEYPDSTADNFVITNGASEALDLVFRSLAPGKVLLPRPYYYSYPPIIKLAGMEPAQRAEEEPA